jgi:hypothetical protein
MVLLLLVILDNMLTPARYSALIPNVHSPVQIRVHHALRDVRGPASIGVAALCPVLRLATASHATRDVRRL